MSRAATLVRSLLILLLLAQSFAVGAMEARAALASNDAAQAVDDDALPPCHRMAADVDVAAGDEGRSTADCCSHGACRCLGLMLALPQVAMAAVRAEAPAAFVVATVAPRLPAMRLERPLRPPSC